MITDTFNRCCLLAMFFGQDFKGCHIALVMYYNRKFRQVDLLPMFCRFDLNSIILFHEIVNYHKPFNLSD